MKNLFTQEWFCHATYKSKNNEWLHPEEVKKIGEKKALNLKDKSEVTIGPSESMSKSKKNTVDPEKMINECECWICCKVVYFYPTALLKKDVQWSDSGVSAANKFLQKNMNLNHQIIKKKN